MKQTVRGIPPVSPPVVLTLRGQSLAPPSPLEVALQRYCEEFEARTVRHTIPYGGRPPRHTLRY